MSFLLTHRRVVDANARFIGLGSEASILCLVVPLHSTLFISSSNASIFINSFHTVGLEALEDVEDKSLSGATTRN